jgi:hypothetical protein
LAEFDHLLAERATFAQQIQSRVPIETATALAFTDWIILAGVAVIKLKNFPPSKGYEASFIEAGTAPIIARGLANVATKHGKRIVHEAKHHREVAKAIRFLAKARQKGATERRARIILKAWRDTSVVETLFESAGLKEAEFVRLLQELDDHGNTDYERLAQLAAQIVPHLSLSRGPKMSAASAAHAFLLQHDLPVPPRRRPHSRKDRAAENVDRLTEATRTEFCEPNFDSRPMKRRSKRLMRRASPLAQKIA